MFEVKDSGTRQEFSTGSVRDSPAGKGRFDLLRFYPLLRVAVLTAGGAEKYGERNWEKGQPLSRYLDSAIRHLLKLSDGQTDEDHAAACVWNVMAFMWTQEQIRLGKLPKELNDVEETEEPFRGILAEASVTADFGRE